MTPLPAWLPILQSVVPPPAVSPDLMAWIVLVLVALPLTLYIGRLRSPDHRFLQRVFLVALLLRVAAAVVIRATGIGALVAGDPAFYNDVGTAVAREWAYGFPSGFHRYLEVTWSGWGLVWLVSLIYYVAGPSLLLIEFLASVAGALVALVVYAISGEVFQDRRVARVAAVLVAVIPALILWSSQGLKDPFITLAVAVTIWCVLRGQRSLPPWLLVLTGLSLFVTWSFRAYVAYILLVSIAAAILLQAVSRPGRAGRAFLVVVVASSILVSLVGSQAAEQVDIFSNLSNVAARRAWSAQAATSGFAAGADVSTPARALAFLPIGLVNVLLAPFPWQMSNPQQQATLPDMIIWWALFPFLLRGVYLAVRHALGRSAVLLLFSVALASAYAISVGNLGTVYRQRTQFVVFLVVFVALGLVDWWWRRTRKKAGPKTPHRTERLGAANK